MIRRWLRKIFDRSLICRILGHEWLCWVVKSADAAWWDHVTYDCPDCGEIRRVMHVFDAPETGVRMVIR